VLVRAIDETVIFIDVSKVLRRVNDPHQYPK
jgi:hypothetical protein